LYGSGRRRIRRRLFPLRWRGGGFSDAIDESTGILGRRRNGFHATYTRVQFDEVRIDVIEKPARFAILQSTEAIPRQRIAEEQTLLRTRDGYIEKAALFFEVSAAAQHHLRREEIFFESAEIHIIELKPLCHVYCHQGNFVRVLVLILVLTGNQGDFLKKGSQ